MSSLLELEQKVTILEGRLNHLIIRSELTLYILSAMIESGVIKREGVEELIKDAKFSVSDISSAIIEKEKEIVSIGLRKVKLS